MSSPLIAVVVAAAIVLVAVIELVAAALPVIVVIALVPPAERQGLAEVIAAIDSSKRLRLWPALRASVRARRNARHRKAGDAQPRWRAT